MLTKGLKIPVPEGGEVSALLHRPEGAIGLFVLGHGSGSNMRVPLIEGLAAALSEQRVATLRFQYPYSEAANFVPFSNVPTDTGEVLIATLRAAYGVAAHVAPDLPIFVGGHSLSALATSRTDAAVRLKAAGFISLGYPLGSGTFTSSHLVQMALPSLFVQGTEDSFGTVEEIEAMVASLQDRAQLEWIDGASHVFVVAGRKHADVMAEMAAHIAVFVAANR